MLRKHFLIFSHHKQRHRSTTRTDQTLTLISLTTGRPQPRSTHEHTYAHTRWSNPRINNNEVTLLLTKFSQQLKTFSYIFLLIHVINLHPDLHNKKVNDARFNPGQIK